jgi:sigma-B regulation protein RsbU (phosphoserine phosphatase)
MGAWLRETARALGMPEALAADLEVCAHEAAENAVSYGYATGVAGEIRLRLALDEGRATLVIEDDGRPFDPLQYPLRARPARPEDVRAGGLGIALMRSLVPECRYARAGGRNVLTLIAPLASFRSRGAERRQARGAPPAGMVERRSGFDRRHDGRALGGRLFSGIPWDAAERALAGCPVRALADGEALLEPGQPNDSLFLLLSGLLKVHLPEAYAGDVIDVEPGASVGELSLLDGMPTSARVTADGASRVAEVPARVFHERLLPLAGFARNVLRQQADRMRAANDVIVGRTRSQLALESLHKELAIARTIQTGMVPPRGPLFADRAQFELHGLMDPANEIGGDYYDALMPDARHLVLAIGDVSGKGIPAALFMARALSILRTEAGGASSPARLVERANALLCAHNETGMFTTLCVAALDLESGELRYSNAGHLPLALARAGGAFGWLVSPRGLVAGMERDARYAEATVRLAPQDRLVFYTDGVTEAAGPDGNMFGDERLLATLSAAPGPGARDALEHLRAEVERFAAGVPQSDDITLFALRYLG